MNERVKKLWLKELRSGEWKQGQGALMNDADEACCLGVLCDIAIREGVVKPWKLNVTSFWNKRQWEVDKAFETLPPKVQHWAGLTSDNPVIDTGTMNENLAAINDGGASFKRIADLIEKNL